MSPFQFNTEGISLTKSEQKIIDHVYKHIPHIPFLSITELSKQLNISVATLSRFVNHLGYQNYKGLKNSIVAADTISPADKLNNTLNNDDFASFSGLLSKQITYLIKTQQNLSTQAVDLAVETIVKTDTIYIFGKGAASGLAKLLAFRLNRFSKKIFILPPSGSELFEQLANIRKGDLIILFGFNKMPVEAKILLAHRKEIGYSTLLFTDTLYCSEETTGDINLFVYRGEPEHYHSMVAPTALIDTLVLQIAKALKQESIESLNKLYQLKEKYGKKILR